MNKELTNAEREWGLSQYHKLSGMIENGAWDHSKTKLKNELAAYKMSSWCELHPVWSALIFLCLFPLGFIPAILLALVVASQRAGREKYEVHLVKLKHGKPMHGGEVAVTSPADEIRKLHKLKQEGVLSEDEFLKAKQRLVS